MYAWPQGIRTIFRSRDPIWLNNSQWMDYDDIWMNKIFLHNMPLLFDVESTEIFIRRVRNLDSSLTIATLCLHGNDCTSRSCPRMHPVDCDKSEAEEPVPNNLPSGEFHAYTYISIRFWTGRTMRLGVEEMVLA